MDIEAIIEQTQDFQTILAGVSPGSRQLVTGLNGSARTAYVSALFHQLTHSILIVTDNGFHASQ